VGLFWGRGVGAYNWREYGGSKMKTVGSDFALENGEVCLIVLGMNT